MLSASLQTLEWVLCQADSRNTYQSSISQQEVCNRNSTVLHGGTSHIILGDSHACFALTLAWSHGGHGGWIPSVSSIPSLSRWFSTRGYFVHPSPYPGWYPAVSWPQFYCGVWEGTTGIWFVEDRDAANILQSTEQLLTTKRYLAPNVNHNAEVKTLWSGLPSWVSG